MTIDKQLTHREAAPKGKSVMKHILYPEHQPHVNNVLCGRNYNAHNHGGNLYFRRLVKSFKVGYVSGTKQQKREYSQIIYNKIRQLNPPGQFLKYNPNTSTWDDIGEKKSLYKIKQALREGAPDLRHTLTTTQVMRINNGQSDAIKSTQKNDTFLKQSFNIENMNSYQIRQVVTPNASPSTEIPQVTNSASSSEISKNDHKNESTAMDKRNKAISLSTIYPGFVNGDRVLDALPGPRIIPTRYF